MTQKDLYIEILLLIHEIEGLPTTDFTDPINHDDLDLLCANSLNSVTNDSFLSIINIIDKNKDINSNPDLENPIQESRILLEKDFTPLNDKYKRIFHHIENDISCIVSECWFKSDSTLIKFTLPENEEKWKLLELIYFLLNDRDKRKDFLEELKNKSLNRYYILKEATIISDAERLYSYSLLQFLNNKKTLEFQNNLHYTSSSNKLSMPLSYNALIDYEQYTDIYDVINELNQSTDILTRFMKIYHILEFMAFRYELVKLSDLVKHSRSFLRQFNSLVSKVQRNEYKVFKDSFREIFRNEIVNVRNILKNVTFDSNQQAFIKRFMNTTRTYTDGDFDISELSSLIYQIRCSIVHNKDSEVHFTISHPEDYEHIIPLITKIIEVFESLIIDKLNSQNCNIKYNFKELELY